MVLKDFKLILFIKFLWILIFFCFTFFLFILTFFSSNYFSIDYIYFFMGINSFLDLNFLFSLESLIFSIIVFLVVRLVCFFRETYLESYKVKKYFFLIIFFFSSMILLVWSNRRILFLFSWDLLGVSSVFLILYYPNEVRFFNSMVTIFFNRLGDIFLIFYIFLLLKDSLVFRFRSLNKYRFFLICFCIFTKRAQFPFSNWLPLAISAPTPISAIVHSSTLVTAGVFLLFKFSDVYYFIDLIFLISLTSRVSFFLGGFIACLEKDFKKIIAFSTISQISMIILFLSFNFKIFCIIHIFFHAIFKSLLFACCGIGFFFFFIDQNGFNISLKNFGVYLKFIFFFTIFSMRGLNFSLRFFRKDFVIEWSFSSFNLFFFFILLILGSFLTIRYGKVVISCCVSFFSPRKIFFFKNFSSYFFFFLFYMFFFMILFSLLNVNGSPTFYLIDLIFVNLFLLFCVLNNINFDLKILRFLCFNNFFFSFIFHIFLVNIICLLKGFYNNDYFLKINYLIPLNNFKIFNILKIF